MECCERVASAKSKNKSAGGRPRRRGLLVVDACYPMSAREFACFLQKISNFTDRYKSPAIDTRRKTNSMFLFVFLNLEQIQRDRRFVYFVLNSTLFFVVCVCCLCNESRFRGCFCNVPIVTNFAGCRADKSLQVLQGQQGGKIHKLHTR